MGSQYHLRLVPTSILGTLGRALLTLCVCVVSVGSYAELVRLEEVDVVYVGTLHSVHKYVAPTKTTTTKGKRGRDARVAGGVRRWVVLIRCDYE